MIDLTNVDNVFTYHVPRAEQIPHYEEIRKAGLALSVVILKETPVCADQQAALRKVREAVMTANAAIATEGKS